MYSVVGLAAALRTLRDGTLLAKRVLEPKGEVKNPMTDADLEAKFRANCETIIGKERCDRLLADVWDFDRLGGVTQFYMWG